MRSHLREFGLPLLLLAATLATTTAAGARYMQNFAERMPPAMRESDLWPWGWLVSHPEMAGRGWVFSLPLVGILLLHEFGHYFACRRRRIRSTLPWVLPAPTLSGTLGAVIRIRSRIPSRDALIEVGIYGPLAGYVASVAAVAAGFLLSVPAHGVPADVILRFGGEPLTIRILHALLLGWNRSIPAFDRIAPHPVLIAGWIGLFFTALNLIPGGQLDGGHILYAISPRAHRLVTRFLPFALLLAGIFYWAGWIVWGLMLWIPAMRHPSVPHEPGLTRGRVFLGAIALALLLLTFTPTPFSGSSLLDLLRPDAV